MKLVAFGVLPAMALICHANPPKLEPGPEIRQEIRIPASPSRTAGLDWLLDHESLFSAGREPFESHYPQGSFTWLDREKTRARFNPDRIRITLRGAECGETIVSFKKDRIAGVMISVLNKGDDGFIKDGPFRQGIASARRIIGGSAKVAETPRRKNETISKAEGFVWSTKRALFLLEYLWVPEEIRGDLRYFAHGEFVRIRILPPQILLGSQQNTLKTNVSRPTLAKRVKREGGKVWLEGLPMVDQGSKGYCAVASFERVMRYYGSEVDMHDLADLANSNVFGTSPTDMKDAMHRMAVRSGLRTREPVFMEGKHYVNMMDAYNREAKKAAVKPVEDPPGLAALYRGMDPRVFKEMRRKDPGYAKFRTEVARSIDAGIPVLWALQLGMFWEDRLEDSYEANRDGSAAAPEKGPAPAVIDRTQRPPASMSGGHLRIIIGYDSKAGLIYYTDSWGPGHEMKKMDIAEAWAVTMGLFVLEP